MTIEELYEKYLKMCDANKNCDVCKYNRENCFLYFGYIQGREELKKQYAEIEIGLKNEEARKIRADAIAEIHTELITEIALLNATKMTDVDLYTFAVRIKEITDKLMSK